MRENQKFKIALLVLLDILIVNINYLLALLFRFEFDPSGAQFSSYLDVFVSNLIFLTVIKLAVFVMMGLYRSLWRYAGTDELVKIALACVLGGVFAMAYLALTQQLLPRSVHLIAIMLDILLVGGVRFSYRWVRSLRYPGNFNIVGRRGVKRVLQENSDIKRIMLVGAGDAGAAMIKEISMYQGHDQRVVVAVDDNRHKLGQRISGVKIAGTRSDIPKLVRKYSVDEIIIAIPSASKKQVSEIVEICRNTKCDIKIVPSLMDLITDKVSIKSLRDVDIEDLLGREPVRLDLGGISGYIEERIVLVTGAGGSIGSELCRQIARFKPRRLLLFDIYENSTYELANELNRAFPELRFNIEIGSVRDRACLDKLFEKYRPHVIFHAAAHKHVPLMEDCPKEAIINNVLGTKNVMDMAEKYLADKFVLISTDKAVNPTNVMGATKRMCEMLMQFKAGKSGHTSFVAVRFGNVLGSNGSVIPLFRRQIAAGGPVTVTDPEITRFFMTIPEAVQLILQTGSMAKGGEIFILDMGKPVRILDLAENLIRLSGLEPYEDIDIVFTGLRPGEKKYEELLLAEEGIKDTEHNKIFVGHPIELPEKTLEMFSAENGVEAWVSGIRGYSDAEIKQQLTEFVPTYKITPNL